MQDLMYVLLDFFLLYAKLKNILRNRLLSKSRVYLCQKIILKQDAAPHSQKLLDLKNKIIYFSENVIFVHKINEKLMPMEKIQMQVENTIPSLLGGFSEMPLKELEHFIKELNALAIRKRVLDKGNQDKVLLRKINETVLTEPLMERYIGLQDKMEVENLSDTEYQELLNLVDKEEKIRNKRFQYLLELSQLRGISLTELMNILGLNILNHA